MDTNPRWLSLASAAKYASMSKKTLKKYIVAGEIYGSLKGGKWFVDRESIDNFFLQDKVKVNFTFLTDAAWCLNFKPRIKTPA